MARQIRNQASLLLWPAVLALGACATLSEPASDPFAGGRANATSFRIYVENDNFYDARIYAIASGSSRRSLGYVTGKSTEVFTVPWEFSNDLRVQIDLQAGPTCTTESIPVDPGDELRLQILSNIQDMASCRYGPGPG
jgi:hypothetical protein